MITIDPEVFAYNEDKGYSNETFVVTGEFDPVVVVSTLTRVGERFMNVDETGTEHSDYEAASDALMRGLYTPNYVADPTITDRGVEVYVDCKASVESPMGQTFLGILRQELEAAVTEARVEAVV